MLLNLPTATLVAPLLIVKAMFKKNGVGSVFKEGTLDIIRQTQVRFISWLSLHGGTATPDIGWSLRVLPTIKQLCKSPANNVGISLLLK